MRRGGIISSVPVLLLAAGTQAHAQSRDIGSTASSVFPNDKEYRDLPTRLGPLDVTLSGEVKSEYDDNVYAAPVNKQDDFRFEFSPKLQVRTSPAPVMFNLGATGTIRRFADLKTENTESWLVDGQVLWSPDPAQKLRGRAFVQRAVEDRGDPESRQTVQNGPRRIDAIGGELGYRRDSGRILLDLEGEVTKFDAVSQLDDNRDFTNFTGRATVGLRTTRTLFITATGFATYRDFRLELAPNGQKRNSLTYGGRLGIDLQPGGVLEGSLSAGVFRYDPEDSTIPGRTGLSVAGNLVYRPRQRTAIILNAFNGDVATFRTGGQGRTDTTVRLAVQQEIRHNLFGTLSGGYRRTKYIDSGQREETFTAGGELEYLFNRNLSVALIASYGDRDSDVFSDNYKRFRGGISLRGRF